MEIYYYITYITKLCAFGVGSQLNPLGEIKLLASSHYDAAFIITEMLIISIMLDWLVGCSYDLF